MSEADFIPLADGSEAGGSTPKPTKKRKEAVNTTLFVSSLPYTATTTDLLTHFSYLGPVRHGFVATDKATGKTKGVGYVTYSLREDAEQAVAELDNKEFGAEGRKIRVSWANEKPSNLQRSTRPAPDASKIVQPGRSAAAAGAGAGAAGGPEGEEGGELADPNAIRTLVLSGLPEVNSKVLWKKVRKVHDGIDLVFPVPGQDGVAHLVFPSHADAVRGLPKLQGHTYKGVVLTAVLKKQVDKLGAGGKGVSHAGRVIVRNLPWDANEQDLRATFLPYGPVNSINIPTTPSKLPARNGKPAPPRMRGFAFVWFINKSDAEKAIVGANGKPILRAAGRKGDDRVVAVDWALSKEKWQEAQGGEAEAPAKSATEAEDEDDDEDSRDDEEEAEAEDDSDHADDGDEEEEEEGKDDESEAESEEATDVIDEPTKPSLPTVDVGSTLFVRNVPFEVTEQELNQLFRTFGPLRYARITIDKATGRSRGSGFVCYWKTEHADAAIEEAERVKTESGAAGLTGANAAPVGATGTGIGAGAAKNPFALPSVLTIDPSSSLASKLVLHGRTLDVTRAVTRETAGQMKEDGDRARQAGDKRNTYLLREGGQALPAVELEKRQAALNARRTLLRSNPSLYISKTRLSVRQLPLFVTDRGLKRLAIHAIRQFDGEVEKQEREGLSRTEASDPTLSPAIAAREAASAGAGAPADAKGIKGKSKGHWKKGKQERETPVIQSKVVRQTEKVDPLTGAGRSKGYGFLEMRSHREALKVLRWANNNDEVGQLVWGWWRDEMGELLERGRAELKRRRESGGKADVEGEGEGGGMEVEDNVKMDKDGGKGKDKQKHKETMQELEARVRKLEERVKEGDERSAGGMRGGKTLLIEFSIENVQVIRRRVEKISATRGDRERERGGGDTREGRDAHGGAGVKRKAAEDTDDEDAGGSGAARDHRGGSGRDGRPAGRGMGAGGRGGRGGRGGASDRGAGAGAKRPRTTSGGAGPDQRGGDGEGGSREKRKSWAERGAGTGAAPVGAGAGAGAGTKADAPREKRGIEKMGAHMGSLIGRKRKMRKGGK